MKTTIAILGALILAAMLAAATFVNPVKADTTEATEVKFDFRAFARDPKKFTGKTVKISGKVLQAVEDDDEVNMRVATSGSYDNIVYVTYTRKSEDESRILNDDRVSITGTFAGLHSYSSVGAGQITIPHVEADKVEQLTVETRKRRR